MRSTYREVHVIETNDEHQWVENYPVYTGNDDVDDLQVPILIDPFSDDYATEIFPEAQIHMHHELKKAINERGPIEIVAIRDLERYYNLMASALQRVESLLTRLEMIQLLLVTRDYDFECGLTPKVFLLTAICEYYHHANTSELEAKILMMSDIEAMALIDFYEVSQVGMSG